MSMKIIIKKSVLVVLTCTCLIITAACAGCDALPNLKTTQPTITRIPPTNHPELTQDQILTLDSLEKLDDYPLYVMHYYADYETRQSFSTFFENPKVIPTNQREENVVNSWMCSLFAAFGDPEHPLFGRNFDWRYSPALLLYTYPQKGNTSVSLVDIEYLVADQAVNLLDLTYEQRLSLLAAPAWPFDGMNACGLAIGMAAVPSRESGPTDSQRPDIGSLGIIREILDHTCTVDEAINLMNTFNILWDGGPALHYLIADRFGEAVLVEFLEGEIQIIPNQKPWHQATNFLLSERSNTSQDNYNRYDAISEFLMDKSGKLTSEQAMTLLSIVSQDSTQWSSVYNLKSGEIQIAIGKHYEHPFTFQIRIDN